jgi:hypothetical protein
MGSRSSEVNPRCAVGLDRCRRSDARRLPLMSFDTLSVSGPNFHSSVPRMS